MLLLIAQMVLGLSRPWNAPEQVLDRSGIPHEPVGLHLGHVHHSFSLNDRKGQEELLTQSPLEQPDLRPLIEWDYGNSQVPAHRGHTRCLGCSESIAPARTVSHDYASGRRLQLRDHRLHNPRVGGDGEFGSRG